MNVKLENDSNIKKKLWWSIRSHVRAAKKTQLNRPQDIELVVISFKTKQKKFELTY